MALDTHVFMEGHGFEATLMPALGATVASLVWTAGGERRTLLHPAGAVQEPRTTRSRYGLWPMTPFANRAFGGQLRFGGETLQLPVNDPDQGGTIHGFGWQHAWTVESHAPDAVMLAHDYEGDGPYRYRARFGVAFATGAARFTLSVENRADRSLPFGLGFHPWFPRAAGTALQFEASRMLRLGPGLRAEGDDPVPEIWRAGAPLPEAITLNALDWTGAATITLPEQGVTLTVAASEALHCPLVWSPARANFVCFEPQSHAVGAPSEPIAQALAPLRTLEPGDSMDVWMSLAPRAA